MPDTIALVVTLIVYMSFNVPGESRPKEVYLEHKVESISLCFAMAREMESRARVGTLRYGGTMRAGCQIDMPDAVEH